MAEGSSLISLGVLSGAYAGAYGLFSWIEERLSPEAKQHITAFLKASRGGLTGQDILLIHNALFGKELFSLQSVVRIFVLTIFSFLLAAAALAKTIDQSIFLFTLKYGCLFVFPANLLAIAALRAALSRIRSESAWIVPLIALLDIVLRFLLFYAIMQTWLWMLPTGDLNTAVSAIFTLLVAVEAIATFIIVSLWLWFFIFGAVLLRSFGSLLDIDAHPVRSIGVIAAAVYTAGYAVVLGVGALITQ
ncbi:MAG: hypothetical protein QOF41_1086 [Methylobacteriaceae bacterium]|nr:hypothetical protein [Methylobacteriaceae bacterium]